MRAYVVVTVPQDLLPQVVGELLQFTTDINMVDVVHAEAGRVIHADPAVAEAWLEYRRAKEEQDLKALAPEPTAPEAAPSPESAPAPEPAAKPEPVPGPAPVRPRPTAKPTARDA